MRSTITISLLCLSLILFVAVPARAADVVPFMTMGAGGTSFVLTAGMVNVATKNWKNGPQLVVESASGTLEIARRLKSAEGLKKIAFAMTAEPEIFDSYKGEGVYKGKPFSTLRSVCYTQDAHLNMIVLAKSGIKSYNDLRGKRVAVGGPGSAVNVLAMLILKHYGITKNDFKPYFFSAREVNEGLTDGSLDAGVIAAGYPVAGILELATKDDIRLLPVDKKVMDAVIKEKVAYVPGVIKAKAYRGVDQDVPVVGWTSGVWTPAATPDAVVYGLLKTVFENLPAYYAVHQAAKGLTKETVMRSMTHVPPHPGAVKYLKEIGVMK